MATRKWNPDHLQHGFTDSSELCHWGIKGMKWGVRRFQNKDGSLTPAGKKRYSEAFNDNPRIGFGSSLSIHNARMKSLRQKGYEYAANTDDFKKTAEYAKSNKWYHQERYINDIENDPSSQMIDGGNPEYTKAVKQVLQEYRKDPYYKKISDEDIVYQSGHRFERAVHDKLGKMYRAKNGISDQEMEDSRNSFNKIVRTGVRKAVEKTTGEESDMILESYLYANIWNMTP